MKINNMFRKFAFTTLGLTLVFSPVITTAAALTSAQISAIMGLLQSFGADQGVITNVSSALNGGSSSTMSQERWCHTFSTNMGIGNTGAEVQALLMALNKNGIVSDILEGLHGRPDQAIFDEEGASYVSAFQEKYRSEILTSAGLSSPTGYIGARTRAKLNALYGCGTLPPPLPPSVPPLPPTPPPPPVKSYINVISPNGGETFIQGTSQTIQWQDNSNESGCPTNTTCTSIVARLYDITLTPYSTYACSGDVCPLSYSRSYTVAKNIYGSSYTWSVGQADATSGVPNGSYLIQVCRAGTSTCDSSDSYFKITSNSTTNRPPVINSQSGPTTLSVGQSGTWTIKASDPENGTLSYSVDWGDNYNVGTGHTNPSSATQVSQASTFTHSYYTSGNYKVTFTVTDSLGATAQSSMTVLVVSSQANDLSVTTTSLPGGVAGQSYSTSISATGGSDSYLWKVSAGSLPPGLKLTNPVCFHAPCQVPAELSGTLPSYGGSYSFTVTLVSGSQTVSKNFTIATYQQ